MVDTKEVAENIYLIDSNLYSIPQWGGVYLIDEEKKALIDSGTSTSAKAVLDGIKMVGVKPEDIDYIVITHIHLDHAGGAGVLVRNMPRAQVIVHPRGAKHLVDPAKLVDSVRAIQGDEFMAKCGEVSPIETKRVKPLGDGDVIELGDGQTLRFIDAPGHAPHQLCTYESRNNGLFVGDSVGLHISDDDELLLQVTPLPSFDLELFINTIERLMRLNVSIIYFAHFGPSRKVQEKLQEAIDKLKAWGDIVAKAIEEGGIDSARERLTAQACAELEPIRKRRIQYRHLTENLLPVNVAGYIKYYREKYEAELSKGREVESN